MKLFVFCCLLLCYDLSKAQTSFSMDSGGLYINNVNFPCVTYSMIEIQDLMIALKTKFDYSQFCKEENTFDWGWKNLGIQAQGRLNSKSVISIINLSMEKSSLCGENKFSLKTLNPFNGALNIYGKFITKNTTYQDMMTDIRITEHLKPFYTLENTCLAVTCRSTMIIVYFDKKSSKITEIRIMGVAR